MRRRTFLILFVTAILHWALWLAYANNIGIREMIVGVAGALLATIAAGIFAVKAQLSFVFRARDVVQGVYLVWYAVQGTGEVLHALAKQLFTREGAPSFTGAVPFTVGGDDPQSAARRALAVTYTTITPNFVVLGIAHRQKLMLYHQIIPGKVLTMTRHLGARP